MMNSAVSVLVKSLNSENGIEVNVILNDLIATLYSSPGCDATSSFKILSSEKYNDVLKDVLKVEAGSLLELAYRCTIPTAIILEFSDALNGCSFLEVTVANFMKTFSLGALGKNPTLSLALDNFLRFQVHAMGSFTRNNGTKYHKLLRGMLCDIGKSWLSVLTTQPRSVLLSSIPTVGIALIPNSFELFGIKGL
jgi:hypothetical protein